MDTTSLASNCDKIENKDVRVVVQNHRFFIWSLSDYMLIRRLHRLRGFMRGCNVECPSNTGQSSLPAQLSVYEAYTLFLTKSAYFISSTSNPIINSSSLVEVKAISDNLQAVSQSIADEGVKLMYEHSKAVVEKQLNDPYKRFRFTKRSKKDDENSQTVSEQILTNLRTNFDKKKYEIRAIPTTSPYAYEATERAIVSADLYLDYAVLFGNLDPLELLKCRVFHHLHSNGWYLTDGTNFGGDFLVYAAEPDLVHAWYIVKCHLPDETFSAVEFISAVRIATSVRKALLLYSYKNGDESKTTNFSFSNLTPEAPELSCVIIKWQNLRRAVEAGNVPKLAADDAESDMEFGAEDVPSD